MGTRTALATSVALIFVVTTPVMQGQNPPAVQVASTSDARRADAWPRVHIAHRIAADIVRQGLDEAARLLEDVRCQAILTEFHTREGRPLIEILAGINVGLQDYLRLILFRDGSEHPVCRDAVAFTSTGGRVVYVCASQIERHWREERHHEVAFSLIHEVLHTLGLGEDPPSPAAITRRIRSRCWAARRVSIPDPLADSLLRLGLDEVARLLADERCQTILTDFHTGQGLPLADTLRGFGLGILDFLPLVHFRDGSYSPSCRNAVAYTSTGSRVVFVCTRAMERHWRENRNHVVFAIIHEVLHTLGLGENPPSSVDITNLIHTRCWPAMRANARQ